MPPPPHFILPFIALWRHNVLVQCLRHMLVVLCLVHTTDTDKTRLSCLILYVLAVQTELATSQQCRRQIFFYWTRLVFCSFVQSRNALWTGLVANCSHHRRDWTKLKKHEGCSIKVPAGRSWFTSGTHRPLFWVDPTYWELLKTVWDCCQFCWHHQKDKTRQFCFVRV